MTPERLEDIRWIAANAPRYSIVVDGSLAVAARHDSQLANLRVFMEQA